MPSFSRYRPHFAGLAILLTGVATSLAAPQGIFRVSVNAAGAQGQGGISGAAATSADGRYVAFISNATNLVPGDTNGQTDVFLRDLARGTVERINVGPGGAQSGGASLPVLSADGRYVAFASDAANLVPNDSNGTFDVFVRDRLLGTTERVSVASGGAQATGESAGHSISADGRFIAFRSTATNLVPGDTNGWDDIFVRDRLLGTTERVNLSSNGVQGNSVSQIPSISADGRFVSFHSFASNLILDDANGNFDVFVRDRLAGTLERVSVDGTGAEAVGGNSINPVLSANGRFVAFQSFATNLAASDTNGEFDIFLRDRELGTTELISVSTAGILGNADCDNPRISADGRFVTYESEASNLVSGDGNGHKDIFVRDRRLTLTERANLSWTGAEPNNVSGSPAISADGGLVAFHSDATNLVPGDTNNGLDVFAVQRTPGTENLAPIANPGPDLSVTTTHDGNPATYGAMVTLNASGSLDVDELAEPGDEPLLFYSWTNSAGVEVARTSSASVALTSPGVHTFHLTVMDAFGAKDVARLSVIANPEPNRAPIADGGVGQTLNVQHDGNPATATAAVTLNGSASSDPDGDSLTYRWLNAAGTHVGNAVTANVNAAPGLHFFRLQVTDPYGATDDQLVFVQVLPEVNGAPIARTGPDLAVEATGTSTTVNLTGATSSDPDGDTLTYRWTRDGAPAGDTQQIQVQLPVGRRKYTLTVTDPYGATSTDDIWVTVGVVDVTDSVQIRKGAVTRVTGTSYRCLVTLTNTGQGSLPSPISLVLDKLPKTVKVVGAAGKTTVATGKAGSSYVTALGTGSLEAGASLQVMLNLKIKGTAPRALPGTQRVLVGLGPR